MKCLRVFGLLIALNIPYAGLAQTAELGATQGQGLINNTPKGIMSEIKRPERAVVGNTYWNESWLMGKIVLLNGQIINNILLRYDIQDDMIEVKTDDKVMGVKGKNVTSFAAYNTEKNDYETFVNADQYMENEVVKTGFFKVITEGEWSLFEKMEVTYMKPNYNPVMGVGNEEPRYVKKILYYMACHTNVFEVPNNKNKLIKLIDIPTKDLTSFMKENDLSVKEVKDLQSIVVFLNKKT